MDVGVGDLPDAGGQFTTLHVEGSTLFELAEEAVAKVDLMGEGSLKMDCDAVLLFCRR